MKPSRDIQRLLDIMAALRTPGTGCPWDLEQSFETIVPFTIEEAYEVADAVARQDRLDLKDELGDLLLQVIFHARLAEEEGSFAFGDVVEAICAKMIRRHPHVFPSEEFGDVSALSPAEVKELWHCIKVTEKAEKQRARQASGLLPDERKLSALDGVPAALPSLTRAWKLQAKAAAVGFDWNDPMKVLDKIREETEEIAEALGADDRAHVIEEIGDLLFVIANLARHVGADPESTLAAANAKFERRFRYVEAALAATGRSAGTASLEEMEAQWQAAKRLEKAE
jgi:ATP diphosphatase